jgi:hypothetical protein
MPVRIPANPPCTETGIDLNRGDRVTVAAAGLVHDNVGDSSGSWTAVITITRTLSAR